MARKRHHRKARRIITGVVAIALAILLGGVLYKSTSRAPYRFLQGRDCVLAVDNNNSIAYREVKYTYTFAEDFNTVYAMASKELLSMGFHETKRVDIDNMQLRYFNLQGPRPQVFEEVIILGNLQATRKETQGHAHYMYREGWSSVAVWRSSLKPRWLYWIDRKRQSLELRRLRRSAAQRQTQRRLRDKPR